MDNWYNKLNKSVLTPPPIVFSIVWTILYLTIIASFVVYLRNKPALLGIVFFLIQLGLNLSWTPVFFRLKRINLSLLIIILTWIFILLTMFVFYQTSRLSAYLLIPYVLWVSFAIYLNAYIVNRN
jgi:benzodiazapine receptor